MKWEQHWYHKLGDLATEFAEFCVRVNKPIKGIHVLQKGILKIQDGNPNLYTNLHLPCSLLCKQGHCYQHSLKIIDHKITDYKTVAKLEKP